MTCHLNRTLLLVAALHLATMVMTAASLSEPAPDSYLSWTPDRAEAVIEAMDKNGRVGGFFDTRILSTNRSYNYKLSATWLTPDVIRARARLVQLDGFLTDEDTRQLVDEAESVGETVVQVEIDPREGSGVIPLSWKAFLRPKGNEESESRVVQGISTPALRHVAALSGRLPRNYDYDRFWVVFPLRTAAGQPLFDTTTEEAELVVRIYEKEGRVTWPIPQSIRIRTGTLEP